MSDTNDTSPVDAPAEQKTAKPKSTRKAAPKTTKSAASTQKTAAAPESGQTEKTPKPASRAKKSAADSEAKTTQKTAEATQKDDAAKPAPKRAAAAKNTSRGAGRATGKATARATDKATGKTARSAKTADQAQAAAPTEISAPPADTPTAPAIADAASPAPTDEKRGAAAKKTPARKTTAKADKPAAKSAAGSRNRGAAAQKSVDTTAHTGEHAEKGQADAQSSGSPGMQPEAAAPGGSSEQTASQPAGAEQSSGQAQPGEGERKSGRGRQTRGQRGRGRGKRQADAPQEKPDEATPAENSSPVAAGAAPSAAQEAGPADFPSGFGDTGPEDYFASVDGNADDGQDDDDAEPGEKKRRSRSRRGRGRGKKAAEATADEAEAADLADDDDDDDDDAPTGKGQGGKNARTGRRKMFVSVLPEEQIEVVITEEGQVQEYYVEMLHQAKTKGNIYKGIVHNVDPNLQAAFVSYGAVKNGFLQIDEVHPEYYVAPHEATKGRKYPPIQKVLRPGQEVLVQIVKEPAGTKGAFLTTYLSLPGRFLVLTPGREQIGVSRKVDNESERARLRELLEGLTPGPGLGVIVRTVSMGASKTSLQKDLQQLKRLWKDVRAKGTTDKAPCLVYQEMDLTSRAVRDYLTDAIAEVWIDDESTADAVSEIATMLFPRKQNLVKVHQDPAMTLFERFNVQRQLDQIHSREVVLPSGGRLVIDPTEALTAIDINSGRSGGKNNFEDMAYRTNMEAARMIPLQLRLRDIGGQVVADFIEMRDKSHWREVEKTLRNGMTVDRARYDVGKIGPFGLLEIVRQRLGSSAISISTEPCPCCGGTGMRRNMEWQSQSAMRDILRLLRSAQAQKESAVTYVAEQPLALHLLNNKRQRLLEMEQRYNVRLNIQIRQPEAL